MISKKVVKKIIETADIEALRLFTEIAIEHFYDRYVDNNKINNALEFILGFKNRYEEKNIDKNKVLEYIHSYATTKDVKEFKIDRIDNFDLTITVKYLNIYSNHEHYCQIPLIDVINEE